MYSICRRDSMILTFHSPPEEGRGHVISIVIVQKTIKESGGPGAAELNRLRGVLNFSAEFTGPLI